MFKGCVKYILFSIAVFLTSCSSITKDDKGILKRSFTYYGDTLFVFSIKREDGSVAIDSMQLRNGKQNGWSTSYENGLIDNRTYYVNDKKTGWSINYYESGQIRSELFYINDRKYGSSIFYFRNGSIKNYNCYDFEGNNRRVKLYDSTGRLIKDEGLILAQATINSDSFTINKSTDVIIDIAVSTPPNEKVTVQMGLNGLPGKMKEFPIKENMVTFKRKMEKPGKYILHAFAYSIDTLTNKTYRDTMNLTFWVR